MRGPFLRRPTPWAYLMATNISALRVEKKLSLTALSQQLPLRDMPLWGRSGACVCRKLQECQQRPAHQFRLAELAHLCLL